VARVPSPRPRLGRVLGRAGRAAGQWLGSGWWVPAGGSAVGRLVVGLWVWAGLWGSCPWLAARWVRFVAWRRRRAACRRLGAWVRACRSGSVVPFRG
jgi:hypothetical protein